MSTITQIEESIETLPASEFFTLLGWMTDQHLKVLTSDGFEAPELEASLLQSIDSPRHPVNDALFDDIRALANQASE